MSDKLVKIEKEGQVIAITLDNPPYSEISRVCLRS